MYEDTLYLFRYPIYIYIYIFNVAVYSSCIIVSAEDQYLILFLIMFKKMKSNHYHDDIFVQLKADLLNDD